MDCKKRAYCLTINNPKDKDFDNLNTKYDYLVVGMEEGESGTQHLQIYIYHENKIKFSTLKKLFPKAHIEFAKGTTEDNFTYCTKDGNYFEFGEKPLGQGNRTDLDEVAESIRNGDSLQEIAMKHTKQFIKYTKGIMETASFVAQKEYKPEVIVVDHIPYQQSLLIITCKEELSLWTGEESICIVDKYSWACYIIEQYRHGVPVKAMRGFIPYYITPKKIYLRTWNLTN